MAAGKFADSEEIIEGIKVYDEGSHVFIRFLPILYKGGANAA